MANYYTETIMKKFTAAIREAMDEVREGKVTTTTISGKNSKMGEVASVSLPPFLTCPGRCKGTCAHECYAAKIANLRKTVLTSYARNYAMAVLRADLFWADVERAMMARRFFRFHVSGDILNSEYFERLAEACRKNPHCTVLVFTKRYEIVNAWIQKHGDLPQNLRLLFSGWNNLKPDNPYNLPETTVYEKDEEPKEDWLLCGGNCFECGCRGCGCWKAEKGETIAFRKH